MVFVPQKKRRGYYKKRSPGEKRLLFAKRMLDHVEWDTFSCLLDCDRYGFYDENDEMIKTLEQDFLEIPFATNLIRLMLVMKLLPEEVAVEIEQSRMKVKQAYLEFCDFYFNLYGNKAKELLDKSANFEL